MMTACDITMMNKNNEKLPKRYRKNRNNILHQEPLKNNSPSRTIDIMASTTMTHTKKTPPTIIETRILG